GSDTSYVGVAVGLRTPERYADVYVGVQMALDTLNATRPDGAPLLALRRAPADAKSAVEVAVAFRDDPSVIGVVGHTESDATIDAAPVYADKANGGRRALVAISPTANGTLVTRGNDWIFRVCPVGTATAQVLARFAAESLHLKRVTVVYRNDAMGKDFRGAFLEEFGAKGGEVLEADPFMEEISEFDAYAQRSARRGAQALAVAGNAPDALRARRASRAAGGSSVMLTTNPPPAKPAAGEVADYDGMYYLTLYTPDQPPTTEGARFAAAFQQRMQRAPDHWSALAYDAAMLIGRAAQAEGANRRAIRDWVADVGRGRPAYTGVTGRIAFDDEGDPVDKQLLVRSAKY
ncbi:MAG TPA: ABC transporter substrate-binding protein, partial [Gemmatimonadaceae bacterium]